MKSIEERMEKIRDDVYNHGVILAIIHEEESEFAAEWAYKLIDFSDEMGRAMKLHSSVTKVK